MSLSTYYLEYGRHITRPRRRRGAYAGTAEKPLLMRSRFRFVFRPFHFQNGGRRIKNQHVIVMALGNILLAQGIYKQLGYLGQSPVQTF